MDTRSPDSVIHFSRPQASLYSPVQYSAEEPLYFILSDVESDSVFVVSRMDGVEVKVFGRDASWYLDDLSFEDQNLYLSLSKRSDRSHSTTLKIDVPK